MDKLCGFCEQLCGNYQQWPGRPSGVSICPACITFWRKLGVAESWLQELFGFHGTHYGPAAADL